MGNEAGKRIKIWFPAIKGKSGTDVYTRRLANALQHRGIATEITWFSPYYQFAPYLLRNVPPPLGTHIIHTNSWNGFAFKRPRIPLVVTEHHCVFDPRYRPYKTRAQHIFHETMIRRFEMASFRVASVITAVSHFTASSLANTLGISSTHVIHNWIDTFTFTPPDLGASPSKHRFRLLFIGNLSMRKGADLLVPIMRELGPEFELRFTSGLRALKTTELTDNMVPLGRLTEESELIGAYQQCDALLFPSRFEGFGYVALEAMACGKPVITGNNSALPEIVQDKVTGILCPPDDIAAFVTACRNLAYDPETLRQYGKAARRRAEELFSEDTIIPQYISLYEKLADSRER